MAQQPTVRWNEKNARWMAWVRFPDGSRRKIERAEKAAAQRDLDELLGLLRAQAIDPGPVGNGRPTFNEVIDAWFTAGCPNELPPFVDLAARPGEGAGDGGQRQVNYWVANIRPAIGSLWVDCTATERLEAVFPGHGRRREVDEHDRPVVELPQPGVPVRRPPTAGEAQPGCRGATPGPQAVEAAEEPHPRAGRRSC